MDKVIRDGKVGVLVSPSYGGGFYTWGTPLQAIFDPKLIELAEKKYNMEFIPNDRGGITQDTKVWKTPEYQNIVNEMVDYVQETYDAYTGGVQDLVVTWIPEGTKFIIEEYDGFESVRILEETDWITA